MRNRNGTTAASGKTVLAILFFHINGMDRGLSSLRELHENNSNVRVRICAEQQVFENYNVAELAGLIGSDDWISLKDLDCRKEEISHFYIPVLPFSTVTDLLNFNDARPSIRILLWALMTGKKVSAFAAGADPYHSIWKEAEMDKGTAFLKHEMKTNLQKLKGYGIDLLKNTDDIQRYFQKKNYQVITAEEIKRQADAGLRSMKLEKGTIITPLARDFARKYQIEIGEKWGGK
ncbi:hypothetical protein [Virgibacillus sp. DJP39]|uniref:hypothetical protein n=1 Tax=Virgibacillus sp. DJP39 TaxID=3409790 RepID=UPI003BB7B384